VVCRRCGRDYLLPRGRALLLPCCPKCGAAAVPLRKRMRHNGLSAILAIAALVTLAIAMVTPFVAMTNMGAVRQFSLIGGILELYRIGNVLIATVLLVFSVIFPFAKLLALLVATSSLMPISPRSRRRLHTIATVTGKYSLLDLLVVALVIILVKFKGIAEASALPGTTLFCVAIFLSMASGWTANFDHVEEEEDDIAKPQAAEAGGAPRVPASVAASNGNGATTTSGSVVPTRQEAGAS
jgi:paraquat-inducible protein A